jgi:hypothetical protein
MAQTIQKLKRSNYRSAGKTSSSLNSIEKESVGKFLTLDPNFFSPIYRLNTEKQTPYVWVNDGEVDEQGNETSAQVFFSKAGAALLEETGGMLSKSKHFLETMEVLDGPEKGNLIYLLTTGGEKRKTSFAE